MKNLSKKNTRQIKAREHKSSKNITIRTSLIKRCHTRSLQEVQDKIKAQKYFTKIHNNQDITNKIEDHKLKRCCIQNLQEVQGKYKAQEHKLSRKTTIRTSLIHY
jgi:hypothetical protein